MSDLQLLKDLIQKLAAVDNDEEFKQLSIEIQPILKDAKNLPLTKEYRKIVMEFKQNQTDMLLRSRKDLFKDAKMTKGSLKDELKQTVGMLDVEVEKSRANYIELDTSSKTMQKTTGVLDIIGGSLDSARTILKSIVAKDEKDQWLLYCGLGIFLSTCFYIFYKRI